MNKSKIKKADFKIIPICDPSDQLLDEIIAFEDKAISFDKIHPDRNFYKKLIAQGKGFLYTIWRNNCEFLGFALLRKFEEAYEEFLKYHDPDLRSFKSKRKFYYVESFYLYPRFREEIILKHLFNEFKKSIERRNNSSEYYFSLHAERSNGFSLLIENSFSAKKEHSICNWIGTREICDFLIFKIK